MRGTGLNARQRRIAAAAAALAAYAAGCGHHPHPTAAVGSHETPHADRKPAAADPTDGLDVALEATGRAARVRATRSRPRQEQPARTSHLAGGGCTLDVIRQRESGGNYSAVSASGKYRGAYQFDAQTWRSVGGTGDPAAASPGEQDARAAELMRRRGTQPWSVCR